MVAWVVGVAGLEGWEVPGLAVLVAVVASGLGAVSGRGPGREGPDARGYLD